MPGHLDETNPADRGIDWAGLERTIALAVRFLDNVVDASQFPLERIAEQVLRNRKIGLGVMGWADLLYQLHIPYDSADAITLAERIMDFIETRGRAASIQLAAERGPFPAYETSIYPTKGIPPLRNATITTIAPTGTLSILAGCSSGVEPLFALSFARNVMDGERLVEVNPPFRGSLARNRLLSSAASGRRGGARVHPEPRPASRRSAPGIRDRDGHRARVASPYAGGFPAPHGQRRVKTVNLPNSATRDDIFAIYWMAYEEGCKGVTVYRDGSKSTQVLTTSAPAAKPSEESQVRVRKRPDFVTGFTQKVQTGLGGMYLTVNEVDGKPFEIFATIGKSGHSVTAKAEAIGRLVSLAFRSGIDVADVVGQLKGIGGEHPIFQKKGLLLSIPDAIAWVLENRYLQGRNPVPTHTVSAFDRQLCPDCGGELVFRKAAIAAPTAPHGCG